MQPETAEARLHQVLAEVDAECQAKGDSIVIPTKFVSIDGVLKPAVDESACVDANIYPDFDQK